MFKYLAILISLAYVNCFSQEQGKFPAIDQSDLPDAVFGTPKTYTGSSLFGYIDGGAELYLEYGFTGAWVNEISYHDGKYTVEIYRMTGPEEAYGIFSVSRFKCNNTPPLSPYTCQTPYQLQICSGPFYISIINEKGNSKDSLASLMIGGAIVKNITDKSVNLASWMPDTDPALINRQGIIVKGSLGIMNSAPDLEDLFEGVNSYTTLVLQQDEITILSVKFQNREDAEKFAKGKEVTWLSDQHVLFSIRR